MSELSLHILPEGWACPSLSEVCEKISSVYPEDNPDADFNYIDLSGIDNQQHEIRTWQTIKGADAPSRARRPVVPGDVLFANVRPYLRNIALVGEGCPVGIASTGFTILRSSGAVIPAYLYHWVMSESFVSSVSKKQSGTSYPAVSEAIVFRENIPLPPIAEQKRIVAKVDAAILQAKTAHAELKAGFAAVRQMRHKALSDGCSGQLTADWRTARPNVESAATLLQIMANERKARWSEWHASKKYQEPQRHQEKNLDDIPPTWIWVTFDQCAADITVGHVGTLKDKYVEDGIPFLRSQNVRFLRYSSKGLERISQAFHQSISKSRLTGGELLVTRSGANVGDCCVYPNDAGEANCADLVITRPLGGLLPEYAAIYICSPDGQARLLQKGTGIAQPHFNIGAMRTKPFPLPPIEEQREIVRCVEAALLTADMLEAQLLNARDQADGMIQITIDRAFRGELVPTEASLARVERRPYEDADALLARTLRERDSRPPTPSRRKSSRNVILKSRTMKKLIDEVLHASATPLPAEKVFKETGRKENEVEQFFVELRQMDRDGRLVQTTGSHGETLLSISNSATAP